MILHRPTGTIFFILTAVLIDMIAVGVIMPVLPALVGSFSVSKADNAFWYGVVACSFGAANFLGAPILGAPFYASSLLLLAAAAVAAFVFRKR